MKTPIEVKDIRKGDVIRVEFDKPGITGGLALEYVAQFNGDYRVDNSTETGATPATVGQHFLLDRATPPVDLPSEPTLGWLNDAPYLLAVWYPAEMLGTAGVFPVDQTPFGADHITAFTPAVAVPASALDELRDRSRCYGPGSPTSDFLAAVDAAQAGAE